MVFNPTDKLKIVSHSFNNFVCNSEVVKFFNFFKYLGHILSCDFMDDGDVKREICNLFVRANVVSRRFSICSLHVKMRLYNSFCLCFYGCTLWNHCLVSTLNNFKSWYNKCMTLFFGYRKYDSVTNMLFIIGLPSSDTILHNLCISFAQCWKSCDNTLVQHLCSLGFCYCELVAYNF